ncbi:MAG: hypothetical protein HZB38_01135 [Planctomycetes bacterium]|nr:hypothetical protein [Planctomycetota bacterium]
MHGYLDLSGRWWYQSQESKVGAEDSSWRERFFQESLTLETKGSIYHPNLVEFAANGTFGLLQYESQEVTNGLHSNGGQDGTLWGFDVSANILKQKQYPGFVYARRAETIEPRIFQSSVRTTTTAYGIQWQYLSPTMPTRLRIDWIDVMLEPFSQTREGGERKNLTGRFDTAWKFSEHNVLSLTYEHQSVDEWSGLPSESSDTSAQTTNNYESDDVLLAHRYDFGEKHEQSLTSELNWFEQAGDLDTLRKRWRETLRLKHSEELRSWYDLEYLDQSRGGLAGTESVDERSWRASGAVEHRLYESLVTQLNAFGQRQEFNLGADLDRYGGEARFDYNKKTPWGTLLASYSGRMEKQTSRGGAFIIAIREEAHTFRDPDPITLANTNVETSTLVVRAQDRITFYQRDRDFRLRINGDRLELERIPTGRIADGQTIIIDYTYSTGGDYDLDTTSQNAQLRHNFDFGLAPYYQWRWQDQTISPADAEGAAPEDIDAQIVGVEGNWGGLQASAEYEDHFSSINPFTGKRLQAGYTHRFRFDGAGTVRAAWTEMDYAAPRNQNVEFLTLEARYRQQIGDRFSVEGGVLYRKVNDTLRGPQHGIDANAALLWKFRGIELGINGEFKQFDDDFARSDSTRVMVQLRRRF